MRLQRTFSAGFDRSRLYTYTTYLDYFLKNRRVARRIYEEAFVAVLRAAEQYGPASIAQMRMLEVGCGQHFAATLLFHSLGARITGIDADYVDPAFSLRGYLAIWRHNGFERCVKTYVRHLLFDREYYAHLAERFQHEYGRPLCWDGLDLRLMNACRLTFADDTFDFAFSRCVFEHINDVPAACAELARVLKPGGVAFIETHLFPSLSGGHNLAWARPSPQTRTRVPRGTTSGRTATRRLITSTACASATTCAPFGPTSTCSRCAAPMRANSSSRPKSSASCPTTRARSS